jgi:hypothetical protein
MILKSVFMDMKGYNTLYMYLSRKKDASKCLVVYSVIISFIVINIFIIIIIIIILNHAKNGHAN